MYIREFQKVSLRCHAIFPSALLICLIISLALAPCIRDHKEPLASSGVRGPRNLAAASHPGGGVTQQMEAQRTGNDLTGTKGDTL